MRKEPILLSDYSKESIEAEKVLYDNNISFIPIPSSGEGVIPTLISPEGASYLGLEGVLTYASSRRGDLFQPPQDKAE